MKQKLVEYFFLYKELSRLHKDFGFGETPRSSEGFTESLCCHLFEGFERVKEMDGVKREYDLKNNHDKSQRIEVKGTTSLIGRTTIRTTSNFSHLFWVVILLSENKIQIRKIKKEAMSTFFDKHLGADKRPPVSLSKFEAFEITEHHFDQNSKTITSQRIK